MSSRNFKRRGEPDPRVSAWLKATDPDLLWASVLSFGEIRKGIERFPAGKRRTELEAWVEHDLEQWFEERVLQVTKAIAERWEFFQPELWTREHRCRTLMA
jgi:predicted nucleic acid-binding protein